jgi:hypothetical protein
MKTILLIAVFAVWTLFRAVAGPLDAPMLETQVVFSWDADGDGTEEVRYLGAIGPSPGTDHIYNSVDFVIQTSGGMRLLRPTKAQVPFQPGESVGSGAVTYSNGSGSNTASDNWMPLLSYDEAQEFPGAFWRYRDNMKFTDNPALTFFTNKTELLIGFRFLADTGTHYGWFHFTRPAARFTNAFTLAASDWNPLPGEPIGAGQPPVIPVVPTVTGDGQLRLAWSTALVGWTLEASGRVGPDANWEPVPGPFTGEALLPLPETNRFFRLRRP